MDLREFLLLPRRHWLLMLLIFGLSLLVAGVYAATRTPIYTATSTIFVSSQAGTTVQDLQQGSTFTQGRIETYAKLATTPSVLGPVISSLALDMSGAELAEEITAVSPLNTMLIEITVADSDPVEAAEISAAVASSLTTVVDTLETPVGATASPVKLTLVEEAAPPQSPDSPNIPMIWVMGALIGLILAIAAAVLVDSLDTRMRSLRDVRRITRAPIVGTIMRDPKARSRPLAVRDDPLGSTAEAFRSLRTKLQSATEGEGSQIFVVTSSVPREGKTTTAINLATALGNAGARVALVDADLRNPMIHSYLGIEASRGLTDVLSGRAELEDVLVRWDGGLVQVIPAGQIPPNPSELLGSTRATRLLEVLQSAFDVVIVDTPALLPATDAAVLAKKASGALMVVGMRIARANEFAGAVDILEQVGAPIAGIVINRASAAARDTASARRAVPQ